MVSKNIDSPPPLNILGVQQSSPTQSLPQPTKLTPQQIKEKREKNICFSCDRKYIHGHKGAKKKLFYIEGPNEEEGDEKITLNGGNEMEEESRDTHPIILCHALVGFSSPQNLKVVGFLMKERLTLSIDLGVTHNFINKKLATHLNCFIYPALEF